jgi:hypothetical protein
VTKATKTAGEDGKTRAPTGVNNLNPLGAKGWAGSTESGRKFFQNQHQKFASKGNDSKVTNCYELPDCKRLQKHLA